MLNENGTDAVLGTTPEQRNASLRASATARRHFVLDTNVLLHNSQSIFKFAEHEVVIPLAVIEEPRHFQEKQRRNRAKRARRHSGARPPARARRSL